MFRRLVIINFRVVVWFFSIEGWFGFIIGSWLIILESEILGGGILDIMGNFNFLLEVGFGLELICNVGCICIL